MSQVLMNQNLYENCSFLSTLFIVFLRFHALEIGNIAVDKSLDARPVNRKPLHTAGIGDDEVETRLISSHVDAIGCGLVIIACQYGSPIGFVECQIIVAVQDIQVAFCESQSHPRYLIVELAGFLFLLTWHGEYLCMGDAFQAIASNDGA